jgi:hypothetical protein
MTHVRSENEGECAKAEAARERAPLFDEVPWIIVALVSVMPAPALEETLRALRGRLLSVEPPTVRRVRDLSFLRGLLLERESERIGGDLPYVPSAEYDAERRLRAAAGDAVAGAAPSSDALRARFKSWTRACLAAFSIDEHGAWIGPWLPWRHGTDGRSGTSVPYTEEEAIQAVRDCAQAIGRIPSSQHYQPWRSARIERLREVGISARIPNLGAIYRLLAPETRTDRRRWAMVLNRVFPDVEQS